MQTTNQSQSLAYLSSAPAGPREFRYAWATVLISAAIFLVAVLFARLPLVQFPVFIPIYVTSLVLFDLITAVMLFGKFKVLRSLGLLVLAGGYLFTAVVTAAYGLIFPGLFAPSGLMGSGPQTSSAMYMFWHAGFPLIVMAYTWLKKDHPRTLALRQRLQNEKARFGIVRTVAMVFVVVAGFTAFAVVGHDFIPVFLQANRTTVTGKVFLVGIWCLSLGALWMLGRSKPHSVMDVWLHVVLCAWVFDVALAAVFNTGRYDLGWYMGRIYGLLAACYLLIVLLSENARHYSQLVEMSSELREANEALRQISMQDALTELANRRSFDKYLAEQIAVAVRHKRSVALVFMDVDHFKDYNDHYGHQAGDACLKLVADALQSCCQRPADLAARYGGEEFAMVLPDTDLVGASYIAEAARAAVVQLKIPHAKCSTGEYVSISSGVAIFAPGSGMTPEHLIMAADVALYQAKANGRNQVGLGSTQAPT